MEWDGIGIKWGGIVSSNFQPVFQPSLIIIIMVSLPNKNPFMKKKWREVMEWWRNDKKEDNSTNDQNGGH